MDEIGWFGDGCLAVIVNISSHGEGKGIGRWFDFSLGDVLKRDDCDHCPFKQQYTRHDSPKRCFERVCRRSNIKGFRFHDLRHTAATRMAESGANIVAVKEILGHADIKTTMKYFHPGNSLTEAVEKLAKFNSFGKPGSEHRDLNLRDIPQTDVTFWNN